MTEVSDTDLRNLNSLVTFVRNWLDSHSALSAKFRLEGKFLGPLGEGMALIRLCEMLGSEVSSVEWHGGQRRSRDIELVLRNGRKVGVQVKTTTKGNFHVFTFKGLSTWKGKIAAAYKRGQRTFRLPADVAREFRRQVDEAFPGDSHYWILVSIGNGDPEFFVFGKREFQSYVVEDYERYVRESRHKPLGKGYNLGVTKKHTIRIIPSLARWRESFERHRDDFGKLLGAD